MSDEYYSDYEEEEFELEPQFQDRPAHLWADETSLALVGRILGLHLDRLLDRCSIYLPGKTDHRCGDHPWKHICTRAHRRDLWQLNPHPGGLRLEHDLPHRHAG